MKALQTMLAVAVLASVSSVSYAGRCDGNNGNGQSNICTPTPPIVTPVTSPHTTDTNRKYIERVHGYAHGNSHAVQALRRTTDSLEVNKVDKVEFYADQKRQDDAVQALNDQAQVINNTINNHGDVLSSHQQQIDQLGSRMSGEIANALGTANRALKEARLAQDQSVASLAVAGHSYDHTDYGLQTAISVASFGGSTALAIGAGGKVSERVFLNAAVTSAGSATGGVVSTTFKW